VCSYLQPSLPPANGTRVRAEKGRQLHDRKSRCCSCLANPIAKARVLRPPIETQKLDGGWDVPEVGFAAVHLPVAVGTDGNVDLFGGFALTQSA